MQNFGYNFKLSFLVVFGYSNHFNRSNITLKKVTEVLKEVYDSGEIPEDLSKSIFIALPKKQGAN
jgi:hypothetical protein